MTTPASLTHPADSSGPLAAGLFGGVADASRRAEPLAARQAGDPGITAASRRQSFSDLFRTAGDELHAA